MHQITLPHTCCMVCTAAYAKGRGQQASHQTTPPHTGCSCIVFTAATQRQGFAGRDAISLRRDRLLPGIG